MDDIRHLELRLRYLQTDFRSLSEEDKVTIELMIQSLKNRRPK